MDMNSKYGYGYVNMDMLKYHLSIWRSLKRLFLPHDQHATDNVYSQWQGFNYKIRKRNRTIKFTGKKQKTKL